MPDVVPHYRLIDPAKGEFEPVRRDPLQERERNPQGVRHPFKTAQDHMPKEDRPRVIEWQKRQNVK